jgi:hypothetical protein
MRDVVLCGLMALLAAATFAQNAGRDPARGTAAISGVVRDAASGRPLADAVVSLRAAGGGKSEPSQQFTDEKGRFVFANLAGGQRYLLTAGKPGFLEGTIGGIATPGLRPPIELADGEWVADADISLTSFGGLSGTVTDDLGLPLAGVRVHALPVIPVAGRRRVILGPFTETDDRGRYRISELPPGRYLTMAPRSIYDVAFSMPLANLDAAPILDAGQELSGVDLRLTYAEGHSVSGVLQAPPKGLPAFAPLSLLAADREHLGFQFAVATTRAEADGTFRFTNVPDGAYLLLSGRPIALPAELDPLNLHGIPTRAGLAVVSHAGSPPDGGWRTRVDVGGADVSGLDVPFQLTGSLTVLVVPELDPAFPAPAGDPGVVLEPASGNLSLAPPSYDRQASTPASHVYRGILPVRYVVRTGSQGWTIKSAVAGGRDITHIGLDAGAGPVSAVTVTLTNAAPVLTGTVQTGRGRAQAAVLLFPVERDRWLDYGLAFDRMAVVMTSLAGQYRIADVPAGSYHVVAIAPARADQWRDPDFLARASSVAAIVTLDWGRTTTQELQVVDVR